jgi:hypothetical protein
MQVAWLVSCSRSIHPSPDCGVLRAMRPRGEPGLPGWPCLARVHRVPILIATEGTVQPVDHTVLAALAMADRVPCSALQGYPPEIRKCSLLGIP